MAVIVSLREAIAAHVRDGETVALEGFTHLIPHATAMISSEVEAARRLHNGTVCFVGIGLPSLAANLARRTFALRVRVRA